MDTVTVGARYNEAGSQMPNAAGVRQQIFCQWDEFHFVLIWPYQTLGRGPILAHLRKMWSSTFSLKAIVDLSFS